MDLPNLVIIEYVQHEAAAVLDAITAVNLKQTCVDFLLAYRVVLEVTGEVNLGYCARITEVKEQE